MWCNVSVYVGAKTYRSDRAIYSGRRSRSFDNIKNEISDGRREVPLLQFKVEWYDTNIRTWQRHRQIKYIDIPLAECVDASPYLDSNLFGDEENVTRVCIYIYIYISFEVYDSCAPEITKYAG